MKKFVAPVLLMSVSVFASATSARVPGDPSGLTATVVGPTQIDLSWHDNSADEDGFQIYRKLPGNSFVVVGKVPANQTSYSDTTLPDGTAAQYYVTAFNASGETRSSNTASAQTPNGRYDLGGRVLDLDYFGISGASVELLTSPKAEKFDSGDPDYYHAPQAVFEEVLDVTGSDPIQNLSFHIGITSYKSGVEHLKVTLIHPDGTQAIAYDKSANGSNFDTTFPNVTAPVEPFTVFNGKSPTGSWLIRFEWDSAQDQYFYKNFDLTISSNETLVATTVTDSLGSYQFPGILSGDYLIRTTESSHKFEDQSYKHQKTNLRNFIFSK